MNVEQNQIHRKFPSFNIGDIISEENDTNVQGGR